LEKNGSKNLNFLLFKFTFGAGVTWWGIGEFFFSFTKSGVANSIRNPLLNGIYFAFLLLFVIGACLFSENKIHSIVNKEFFKIVVMGPSLKKIIPVAFAFLFVVAGILEFLYEIELAPIANAQRGQTARTSSIPPESIQNGIIDYYFLLDNTLSLTITDPQDERIQILERLIGNFQEDRKTALITFGDGATIHIRPTFATNTVRRNFIRTINNLVLESSTNIKAALQAASSILVNDPSRKEVIIFITDGEDTWGFCEQSPDFMAVLDPFISNNVPIHTIFLNPGNISSVFLSRISSETGGVYSTVRNPVDIEASVVQVLEADYNISRTGILNLGRQGAHAEPLRDMLEKRTGVRQNSPLHAFMRIAFIALIGLLMGYLLYMVFSNRNVFLPLIIGGGISGLLAGLTLEFGLQTSFFPDFIIRLMACIILSTVIWFVSYIYAFAVKKRYNRNVFAFLGFSDYDSYDDNHHAKFIIRSDREKQSKDLSGVLDDRKEPDNFNSDKKGTLG